MRLVPTALAGVVVVEVEPHLDERGGFARTYDGDLFEAAGLGRLDAQANASWNTRAGTVRGLHWSDRPEAKLVRCVRGAVLDVAVDVRPGSPTFGRHVAVTLTAADRRALLVPAGCAHGFQTLVDDTEVDYRMSVAYEQGADRGVRFDDPDLAIGWPLAVTVLSARDADLPPLAAVASARA